MRISDWSSDVCSSDLGIDAVEDIADVALRRIGNGASLFRIIVLVIGGHRHEAAGQPEVVELVDGRDARAKCLRDALRNRSEERRVGKECVSTCRFRWAPYP